MCFMVVKLAGAWSVRTRLSSSRNTMSMTQFLGAEQRDLGEAFRPRQHSEQAQKQDLIERVDHLATLPRVPGISEMPVTAQVISLEGALTGHG